MAPKAEPKKEEAAPVGNRKSRRGAAGKELAKQEEAKKKEEERLQKLAELQRRKEELQKQLEAQQKLEREEEEKRKAEYLASIAPLTDEERAEEVKELTDIAKSLMDLSGAKQAETRRATIKEFAVKAAGYAGKIRNAEDNHAAAVLKKEVAKKKDQWSDLAQMMAVAIQMEEMQDEEEEALKMAEEKLRTTAAQLSKVSQGGDTKVFEHIKNVAKDAQESLDEFLAAETNEKKWEAFENAEKKREKWLTQIHGVQETMHAEDAAAQKGGAKDDGCEYVDAEEGCEEVGVALSNLDQYLSTSFGSWDSETKNWTMPSEAPTGPAVVLESSPEDVRGELRNLVFNDKDKNSLITALVLARQGIKDDARFSAVFDEVEKLLEQCYALMVAGEKDDKQRAAKDATAAIRKAAFAISKFDIYEAKHSSEKIETNHPEVARCAKLFAEVAEFFKAELSEAPLDDDKAAALLKLVKETKAQAPAAAAPSRASNVVIC